MQKFTFCNVVFMTPNIIDTDTFLFICNKYNLINNYLFFKMKPHITQQSLNKDFFNFILKGVNFKLDGNNRIYNNFVDLFVDKKINYQELLYINRTLLNDTCIKPSVFKFDIKHKKDIHNELKKLKINHDFGLQIEEVLV